MAVGWILIAAVLILGGVIATVGDRIGTRVGKARLSLFKLRPRKTAVLVTIITGALISATTLGLLLALSSGLRAGLFELESIQGKLLKARRDLQRTQEQRTELEKERDRARSEEKIAQSSLERTKKELKGVIDRQKQTQDQLKKAESRAESLRQESERLQRERGLLIQQRATVIAQIEARNQDIQERDREIIQRNLELRARNQDLKARDQEIQQQEQEISQQERSLSQQKAELSRQEQTLSRQEQTLNRQTQALKRQEQEIAQRDTKIAQQQQLTSQGESRIRQLQTTQASLEASKADLERTKTFLDEEIKRRENDLFLLRRGDVVLSRGEILANRIVRVLVPSASQQAVDQLLREANRAALEATRPGVNAEGQQIIQVARVDVDRLRRELEDGREYVVRIIAAGNYIRGETRILVFPDLVPNQVIFSKETQLATTTAEASKNGNEWQERINLLVEAAQFRARRAGMLSENVVIGDGRITSLISFIGQLQSYDKPLTLQAVTANDVKTAGPLVVVLVAYDNGREVFRS